MKKGEKRNVVNIANKRSIVRYYRKIHKNLSNCNIFSHNILGCFTDCVSYNFLGYQVFKIGFYVLNKNKYTF